jgi:acyl-CoA hydrolase
MEATLIKWMGPGDTGIGGGIHGGELLRLGDEAATIAAMRYAGVPTVTAGIEGVAFRGPVRVGDVVTALARVNAAWRSSAEVGVKWVAENPLEPGPRHVMTAYFTMVIDPEFASTMPPLEMQPGEDALRRHAAAERRRTARLSA